MEDVYDVVVVGAGAAGLTAAREAAGDGRRVLLIERMGPGGQISTVEGIENFPGRPEPIAGYDLGVELLEEAEAAGADVRLAQVDAMTPVDDGYLLTCEDDTVRAGAVIVATGSRRLPLGVPGESELEGRGVSHCASCDGPFFRGKVVAVVGGGDSAFDEARLLAEHAEAVWIVHTGDAPTARPDLVERTLGNDNVRVRNNATVSAVHGSDLVESVSIRDAGGTDDAFPVSGLFVYVGLAPNADWLPSSCERDATGRLVTGDGFQASLPGVFVAGDLRSGSAAMLDEAVSDGVGAARAAVAYLHGTRG